MNGLLHSVSAALLLCHTATYLCTLQKLFENGWYLDSQEMLCNTVVAKCLGQHLYAFAPSFGADFIDIDKSTSKETTVIFNLSWPKMRLTEHYSRQPEWISENSIRLIAYIVRFFLPSEQNFIGSICRHNDPSSGGSWMWKATNVSRTGQMCFDAALSQTCGSYAAMESPALSESSPPDI